MRDTQDERNEIKIPKESQVFVLEVFQEMKLCNVLYNEMVCVVKMADFTQVNPATNPISHIEKGNTQESGRNKTT